MIKYTPGQISFSPKRWTMKPAGRAALKRMVREAERLLRTRVQKFNRDIYGRPFPKLAKGRDEWVFFGENDPRFDVPPLQFRRLKNGRTVMVDRKGYGHLKRRMGAKPKRDGTLTGQMWDSLKSTIYRSKKRGVTAKLRFTKSTVTSEVEVEDKTRKKGTRTIRKRIGNRDKARLLQFESGNATKRQLFTLMALTDDEIGLIADEVVAQLRLLK
tara:strand:- start:3022 stop:3663 length:642 start_codon:yes stop_codon:yes gene_type:complete